MAKSILKIGISLRVLQSSNYYEERDAISHDWGLFLESINAYPIMIPNTISNTKKFLEIMELDGLILSGGDNIGDNSKRDKTEKEIIEFGIKNNIPILGICRGMQVINKFFGGNMNTTTNKKHVKKNHIVSIKNIFDLDMEKIETEVNSYHNNIILTKNVSKDLEIFSICKQDQTIEGIRHKKYSIYGVMWHPERSSNEFDKNILTKIFEE